VWSEPEQDLALGQRLANEPEFVVLEISQAAMNELARCRGRRAGKVVLLDEQDAQAAASGVTRNASAIDTAANDE
jgi:hypothetical protein